MSRNSWPSSVHKRHPSPRAKILGPSSAICSRLTIGKIMWSRADFLIDVSLVSLLGVISLTCRTSNRSPLASPPVAGSRCASGDAPGGTKRQRPVRVHGLTAGPGNRMPLSLDLEFGLEPEPLPVGPLRQGQHGLTNAARRRVSRIHGSPDVDLSVVAEDGESKR